MCRYLLPCHCSNPSSLCSLALPLNLFYDKDIFLFYQAVDYQHSLNILSDKAEFHHNAEEGHASRRCPRCPEVGASQRQAGGGRDGTQ